MQSKIPFPFFFLRRNLYLKLKKKGVLVRNEHFFVIFIPFHTRNEFIFFIGFVSIGTDGARTRSFRLDRAVLWPIELQSPGKKLYSILIITIQILSSFYILDSNRYAVTKRGGLIYILISIWICTLVRSTRITSNPFVIAKSIEKWINEKKKTLFCLFTLILSLDFIVIDPADNNLSKSEFVEKNM